MMTLSLSLLPTTEVSRKVMAERQWPKCRHLYHRRKEHKKAGEFQESMVQYDVAATMAYIFGLEQPQVWTGRAMKQVFK